MSDICTESDVAVEEQSETKTEEPKRYRVIFHNDDKTPFMFVIAVLIQIFHKKPATAQDLTLQVHEQGKAVVAIYTYEIAEQKAEETIHVARQKNFPLQVTLEEEE